MFRRVALVLFAALCAHGAAAEPVDPLWTLDAAKIVPADAHDRPVFLFVSAPWSRVSRRFEREVLGDPAIRTVLARDFLCARLDAPVAEEVGSRWHIARFPSCVFLDRYGGWLRTLEGEQPAALFAPALAAASKELAEQAASVAEALNPDAPDLAERVRRARTLVDLGLAPRAVATLAMIFSEDPEDKQYGGLWAAVESARAAFRAGDLAGGDRWTKRVADLEAGKQALYADELARERLGLLRRAGRWEEALVALAPLRQGEISDEARENLDLEEAQIMAARGQADAALARFQSLWDGAKGPAHAVAETELERWSLGAGEAGAAWRTLRDGRELVLRFNCSECHTIEPAVAVDVQASCVQCHKKIASTAADPKELASALRVDPDWYSHVRNVRHYLYAPFLGTVAARLKREWMRTFLRRPVDIRPFLKESMPRLPLADAEIETVLDYLETLAARTAVKVEAEPLPTGDPQAGEKAFVEKGCQACHLFGNRVFPEGPPAMPWPREVADNVRNAPNLRWVRDRCRPETLSRWIREPTKLVPGTLMPANKLTDQELADLIAFLLRGDPGMPAAQAAVAVLPAARAGPIPFEEAADVFLDTCKHCHLPDVKGGIGNTGGGWGYAPRGLNLEEPMGPLRGSFGPDGRRRSILRAESGETLPPILRRIAWRMDENRWDAWAPYHDPLLQVPAERYDHPPGMPLGLPSLTAEEIGTLRGWVEEIGR